MAFSIPLFHILFGHLWSFLDFRNSFFEVIVDLFIAIKIDMIYSIIIWDVRMSL